MSSFKFACVAAALVAGSAMPVLTATAQSYPAQPIKIIVGFPPGQSADVIARSLGAELGPELGTTVIVDNRAGAAGIIGMQATAKSQPDGYTLMMSSSTTLAINPTLYSNLPYDAVADFAPVTPVAKLPLYLVVNADTPVNNVKEFVEYVKANPGKYNFGSAGSGLTNHLAMEMFRAKAGLDMVHVPYKGGPAAMTDLIAGRLTAMFETGPGIRPHLNSGRIRALAVSSLERSSILPDLPTLAESGYPGFEAIAWVGLVAPAGTPPAILDQLSKGVNKVLREPKLAEHLQSLGGTPYGTTPEEFAQYIKSEMKLWGDAVKASGARVD